MGKLTHTVLGNPLIFRSADKANIESLKVYFNPLQEGSGVPSTTNIRPINGWTGLTLNHTGKTLIEIDGGRYDWIVPPALLGQTILYRGYIDNTNGTKEAKLSFRFYDKDNNVLETATSIQSIAVGSSGSINAIFSLSNDIYQVTFNASVSSTAVVGKRYVILASDETLEDSYEGQEINISWSNDCGILYGGYVDLITGTLISDTIMFNLTGSEDYLTYQSNTHRLRIKDFNLTYGWSSVSPISNVFKTATDSNFSVYLATTSSGNQNLNLGFPSDYTEEQARNFIAQNNVQVVCKVSHTTTYQLTPQQLTTFCGQNNIWSNVNDDIEVTYEFTDHMAKRRLELNTPHIETISGNTASFNTDMIAPLKECKVTFFPAQDPYASPSPINVKNIAGWDGIQFQTNRNFIPVIPDNFTTGQLGTSNGIVNYLGDNTYEYIGTIEDGGSILIPIQPIQLLANTNYYVRIVKEPENGLNTSNTALNIAMKTASGSNIFVFRPNQIGWSNYSCGAYTNLEEDLEATSLAIGIPPGSSSFKFKFFLGTSSFALTTVNWNSTYGTIYGGYIDLINGKLVQTHHKITFDGTEQIANSYALQDDQFIRVQFFSNDNKKILHSKRLPEQNLSSCKYSHGKYEVSNTIDVSKGGVVINNTNSMTLVILHLPIELHVSDNVGVDIKNYLKAQYDNGTPVEICYQLRDPIEYQLSTHIIKTIKDTNYMWSNTNGPIEIKYWTH